MPCGSSKYSNSHVDQADKNGENRHCEFEDLDHSILQHPLHSGVRNVKQILKCMETGTKEIKDIILNECNVIYECKVCASLFRSLANFMYHKRCYCKKHLCEEMVLFDNFEETVIVQPEPPIDASSVVKETTPKLLKCTVDLVKTDIGNEKSVLVLNDESESSKSNQDQPNKAIRSKESIDKKVTEVKTEQTMISRRTRDKKSQKGKKKAIIETKVNEPPKKVRKVAEEPCQTEETVLKTSSKKDNKVEDEPKEIKDNPPEQVELKSPIKTNESEKEPDVINETVSEQTSTKDTAEETTNTTKNTAEETTRTTKDTAGETTKTATSTTKDTAGETTKTTTSTTKDTAAETTNTTEDTAEEQGRLVIIEDDGPTQNSDETSIPVESIEENNKECSNISLEVSEKNDKLEENIEIDKKPDNFSKKIIFKPLKKIIFAKPRALEINNSAVFDSIRKNFKPDKIGLTKITNSAGNNVQFPKIVLKTIDGNPHAVFQNSEKQVSNAIDSNNSVQNKTENEKLIIVLKKDSITPTTPTAENKTTSNEKSDKNLSKQTEFHHVTRKKRLLSRDDCNVQELKCLLCNTTFTSLKTLYYHMLAIHSKKRLYYPCPLCKTLFVQIYGVTRHLITIHQKTKEQISKMRESIKKKSVWKKVDDVNVTEINSTNIQEFELKEEIIPESKNEKNGTESNKSDGPAIKTIIKLSKNVNLHQCSKCNRVFGRKSSQVSHEKFCIMNAIKVETVDVTASPSVNPNPMISFLSFSTKKQATEQAEPIKAVPTVKSSIPPDTKVSIRPKRKAEKQMHKDFVNSQTLKWRSVNRVAPNPKVASTLKKDGTKKLEKKVSNIMNVEDVACLKCGKKFSSYSNLKRHVARHVGWTRFKCKHCEYQAYNKSQCWFHVQKSHNVSNNDLEKSVQNLGNWFSKKPMVSKRGRPPKCLSEGSEKTNNKANSIPKLKISKKKSLNNTLDKKGSQTSNKESTDSNKETDQKKVKNQTSDSKREVSEVKKETSQNSESKKEGNDAKKEKVSNTDMKKELNHKKEKTQPATPIYKCSVPDYKKDLSNYKSVTTNNPTTIILSKKLPSSSVQSIMTIPTDSQSSNLANKTFPVRSSPRKIEAKSSEGKTLTSLVTRSTAYSKGPIQIKISPPRSNCSENVKKSLNQTVEKTCTKKDKLISEWFPKKDLNSNTNRRESAPLIIGLVPASNSELSIRTKNPVVNYEKSN